MRTGVLFHCLLGIVFDTHISMWRSVVEWLPLFLTGIVFDTYGYVVVFTFGVPTLWVGIVFDTHGIRASNLPEKFRAPLTAGYCFQDLCWRWEPPIFAGYHFRYLCGGGSIWQETTWLIGIKDDAYPLPYTIFYNRVSKTIPNSWKYHIFGVLLQYIIPYGYDKWRIFQERESC